jgi:hypothetical protein
VVRNSIRYTLLNVSGQAPQDKRDVFFKALDALLKACMSSHH